MLYLKKKLNNNVALAIKDGKELVVIGNGIAFGKRDGDELKEEKAEKIFEAKKDSDTEQLQHIVAAVPTNRIETAAKIIAAGENKLGKKLNFNILLSLADHLDFAIQLAKKGLTIANPLQWEIQQIYPQELEIGRMALKIIRQELAISLPEAESYALAMHFVNANNDLELMKETIELTDLTKAIIERVNCFFDCKLATDNLNYTRFLTHIRYYLLRQFKNEPLRNDEAPIYRIIQKSYPAAYQCALDIAQFLKKKKNWTSSQEEIAYLTLHIERVTYKE